MATHRSGKLSGKAKTILPDYPVVEWDGWNNFLKDLTQLGDGQTPSSLNWITGRYKDHIELRRGYARLGTTLRSGSGRVTGLTVATRQDNTQVPFFTYGQKTLYYDAGLNDTIEIGSNTLPVAANGEDISILPYKNLAGAFAYFVSPNSSWYKVAVASPTTILDLGPTDYRGHAKADSSHGFLWNRNDTLNQKYQSRLFISVPDQINLSGYTQTTAQSLGTGNGATKIFSASTIPGYTAKSTLFNVEVFAPILAGFTVTGITAANQAVVTAVNTLAVGDAVTITGVVGMTQINNLVAVVTAASGTSFTLDLNSTTFTAYSSGGTAYKCEYFIDDQNGKMTSNLGGTGTINYSSGAYSVTFNTAPLNTATIYSEYYYEVSTSGGIADFSGNGAASYSQFDGGDDIQAVFPFDQVQYAFHRLTTWATNINGTPTNVPYRNALGAPSLRAGYPADEGVIFLDVSTPSLPVVKILSVAPIETVITVLPKSLSDVLDLSSFGFSKCVIFRWSEYDIMACAPSLNGVVQANNTALFMRNIYSGQWDYMDIPVSTLDEFNGTLLSGDSLSNNLFTLFSGFDDDGANIANFWRGKQFNLGFNGLKKFNRFVIKGLIQQTQTFDIQFSFDSGNFTTFFTVKGNASYVNIGNPQTVGSSTIGSQIVGGGGDVVTAYPYEVEITVAGDAFEYVQPQFIATGIGYVSIDEFTFKDCRVKGRRILPTRTASPN